MKTLHELLEPGDRIWVAGSANEPTALLSALRDAPVPADLTFVQFPLGGYNTTNFTTLDPTTRMMTFFMTPHLQGVDAARLDFLPMQMRAVYDYLQTGVDVVFVMAARDTNGVLRLGPNVDFAEAALERATRVAVELNSSFVAPAGGMPLDESRVDVFVESERRLYELPPPPVDDTAREIGQLVAGLIRDGDCLQTGIGGIPAAILAALGEHNDLGLHGGLLDDGGMNLIKTGNVTGRQKNVDRGMHVTGMALGSELLMSWLAHAPEVQFRGANYTHDLGVIRQLDNFVSINSAVEVDLYGQVNAEYAAGRQLSGTGGSVDFMRAAAASRGGRSIVAMNATARGSSVSRIVPRVDLVTALRTDVDMVVTEYGIAELKGRSVEARREALTAIAAPRFRDRLAAC